MLEKTLQEKAYPEICQTWDQEIVPQLEDYIRIPNKSPAYDSDWKAHGYMDKAMQLIINWCKKQLIANLHVTLLEEEGHTPLLFIDIPGENEETVLLYGHMDKQPEMRGWDKGLDPWQPVLRNGKLYGRGGADDGYAIFAALTAIATLQRHKIPHARCVVLIEASEESGSPDLPFYLQKLQSRIGKPNLVICLDSGCGNYEQLWSTTSLRGLIIGILTIDVLHKGIHSGMGSGVVPSTFHILQLLLNRIEDLQTGAIRLQELQVNIPQPFQQQAQIAAQILGNQLSHDYPFVESTQPLHSDPAELILNRTWRPALSITGIEGLPNLSQAGNVTIPNLAVKLSIRIPPGCDPQQGQEALKRILEQNPPYQSKIAFNTTDGSAGWQAPILAQWLATANEKASQLFFGKPAAYMGEGGSIPFMGMLGRMYPEAQFLITGVLGPNSNAHGPNEFLHLDMAKKLTGCISMVLALHYTNC